MNNDLSIVAKELESGNVYAVIGHIRPDGDSVGAVCGISAVLESLGKKVYRVFQDEIYQNLKFIPDANKIINDFPVDDTIDTIVICDCSERKRIGDKILEKIETMDAKIINIDHHQSNDFFGNFNYVLPEASSACAVICDVCEEMKIKFNAKMAECFYAGLSSDTGSFRFSSVDAETFTLAGKFAEAGADIYSISTNLWSSREKEYIECEKIVLNNLQYFFDGQCAISYITKKEMKKANATNEHINGLVGVIRDIVGVKIAIFMHEEDDGWKLSIRSKDTAISTITVAEAFGGGGHTMASGAKYVGKISAKKLIKKVLLEVEKIL